MKTTILIIACLLLLCPFYALFSETNETNLPCRADMEYAYFCGQRDAINDNIIIRKISGDVWVWEKSPWGNNTPVLNDTIIDY